MKQRLRKGSAGPFWLGLFLLAVLGLLLWQAKYPMQVTPRGPSQRSLRLAESASGGLLLPNPQGQGATSGVLGLLAQLTGSGRTFVKPAPLSLAETGAALSKPVIVAIKTTHFFSDYARIVPNCTYQGRPITCQYIPGLNRLAEEADALWFHAPSSCGAKIDRDMPHQLTVVMSMEPATYYPCLNEKEYMDQFDIEMTYRKCSQVESGYFADRQALQTGAFFRPPLPWSELQSGIAYVNSNCHALNGRNDIVQHLMGLNRIPVDSYGVCLRNKPMSKHFIKTEVLRKYKFCIAMENSNSIDYVSEKVWQAMESGCLPIYLGAPNIKDYIPLPDSIIDYNEYKSPQKLMDYLEELSNNEELYMKHHRWRSAPVEELSPGFRKLVIRTFQDIHSQCALCQVIMDHRIHRTPLHNTHCLRNTSWLRATDRGGSTWTKASNALLSEPWPLSQFD